MKQRIHKYANGGKVHGTPMGLQKPSTRKRPKVGDKDPNFKASKSRKPPTSSRPPAKKPSGGPVFRDYRGTQGAIDDASGIKRK